MDYSANINGIPVNAHYSDKTVSELLIPLLKRLAAMYEEKQKRILVFLSAPPGAGKSTLVSFLEFLAKENSPEIKLQSIGMDGFHRRQEYLLSHTVNVNGKEISMVEIKGAPVTFDLETLKKKIAEVKEGNLCKWPRYDRLLHNPVEDAISVSADIVLLEGNYLLLDMEGWRALSGYADFTISLSADEEMLRERLIERRTATGVKRDKAEQFVDFSDMANVRLCLEMTKEADLQLKAVDDDLQLLKQGR